MMTSISSLRDEFPELMADYQISFGAGAGWYQLIRQLLEDLDAHRQQTGGEIKICQIKEKFGGLRVYINEGDETAFQMILKAEDASYKICDMCGQPGRQRGPGWIRTRCDRHADESLRGRVTTLSDQLFDGDQRKAERWLETANLDFGGKSPKKVMEEEGGIDRVVAYLRAMSQPW